MAKTFKIWLDIEEYDTETQDGKLVECPGTFIAELGDLGLTQSMVRAIAERANEVVQLCQEFNKLSRESEDRLILVKELVESASERGGWTTVFFSAYDRAKEYLEKEKEEDSDGSPRPVSANRV